MKVEWGLRGSLIWFRGEKGGVDTGIRGYRGPPGGG